MIEIATPESSPADKTSVFKDHLVEPFEVF